MVALDRVRWSDTEPTGVASLVAALSIAGLAFYSTVEIEPGQAAVRLNLLTGAQSCITTPGWSLRLPLIHSVSVLNAAPQPFSMKGEANADDLHVQRLTVRASDGSNFYFEDTTIVFQLNTAAAVTAVRDAGPDHGYLGWLRPYARSILRDEFGRESTIDVANPTTYEAATARAKDRLNESLSPHGVVIVQLVTPRPKFNEDYERAIEERNALGNEEQVIESTLDRAEAERDRRLAEVDQVQNHDIQERRAKLESDLATAITRQAQQKREADTYHIEKIAAGQTALSAADGIAKQLQGELDAKYLGKRADVAAFERQPVERVMEKLATRLRGSKLHIVPYANDATVSHVQYEELRP